MVADQGFHKLRHDQLTIRLYDRHDGHLSILNNRRIDRRYAPASKYRARVMKSYTATTCTRGTVFVFFSHVSTVSVIPFKPSGHR